MSLIEFKNVRFAYDEGGAAAVDHLSLDIERGGMTAILGHNGSGKSTLAKLINGLLLPKSGEVVVDGMSTLDEKNTWEIRRRAGMVFQNPDNQLVSTVVREDVAFGLENIGVPTKEMPARIDEALSFVGMSAFASRAPHTLSGGQKQRVAIAGVLAMRPEILILDEATAMLDPRGREEIFTIAQRLNRESGMTVIWITHFMEEAARCDRVIVMHEGALEMDGAPQEIFAREERLRELRLDIPPMARISARLRESGIPVAENTLTVDALAKEVGRLCSLKSTT